MPSPVLSNNKQFQPNFNGFASSVGVMTFENTMQKIIMSFVVLLLGATVGWAFPIIMLPAVIIGLILGLVNVFKKEPSPVLILLYSLIQGGAVGALSVTLERSYPGIVIQAVLATLCVIAVTLFLYRTGIVRATPKMTKIVLIAMLGYLFFSVVNMILMATGVSDDAWGLRSQEIFGIPLGLILGVFAVLLGAYNLVMDFDFMETGIQNNLPAKFGWTVAFGIVLTVVWIYLEIIRILAILRK